MQPDLKVRSPFLTFGGVEYFRTCANSRTVLAKKSVQSATMRRAACTGSIVRRSPFPTEEQASQMPLRNNAAFLQVIELAAGRGKLLRERITCLCHYIDSCQHRDDCGVNVRLQPFICFDEVIPQRLRAVHCNPGITLTQCNRLRCGSHSNPSEQAFRQSNGCGSDT